MNAGMEARGSGVALTSLLHDRRVSWDELQREYGPLLKLVDAVLGVVPNCDPYLEIWPPAFRTYNVLVPNLLNLPVPVLGVGGPPPQTVGLAMYVASRTAGCSYCSAHSCSFAMRRGAAPELLAAALLPDRTSVTRAELATITVAHALAAQPSALTTADKRELEAVYGPSKAEWVATGAVLMGFLNTFMDVIGVELEQSVADEVVGTLGLGWSAGKTGSLLDPTSPARPPPPADGALTKLRLLRLLPAAVRFDLRWQRGTPKSVGDVAAFLDGATGHDFPVLAQVRSARIRRSIATVLRDNLDPSTSQLGIETKVLAGAVLAEVVDDDRITADIAALAGHAGIPAGQLRDAAAFAHGNDTRLSSGGPVMTAALTLARAGSSSPTQIDAAVVKACEDSGMTAAQIVELITWLSVLQMLRRLSAYALPRA